MDTYSTTIAVLSVAAVLGVAVLLWKERRMAPRGPLLTRQLAVFFGLMAAGSLVFPLLGGHFEIVISRTIGLALTLALFVAVRAAIYWK